MEKIIVGMGEALWDMLPAGKQIGGAPANFAYHVSQFGFKGYAVSAIGSDPLGDELMENFEAKHLNMIIPRVGYPTGTVQVTLNERGVPQYEIMEGVAWDNVPFSPELAELAKQTSVVCFGSLAQRNETSRTTVNAFLDAMPEGDDVYKIFDINLRQHFYTEEIITASLKKCNILKINDEELIVVSKMFGCSEVSPEDQCWMLLAKYNLKMLILTCGVQGSYVFVPGQVSFRGTPDSPVADTVGAGDSFTASFIAGILKGKSIAEAHQLAVDVSTYVCSEHGAMPTLPDELTK